MAPMVEDVVANMTTVKRLPGLRGCFVYFMVEDIVAKVTSAWALYLCNKRETYASLVVIANTARATSLGSRPAWKTGAFHGAITTKRSPIVTWQTPLPIAQTLCSSLTIPTLLYWRWTRTTIETTRPPARLLGWPGSRHLYIGA